MTTNKWDPFRDLVSLTEFIGDSFEGGWGGPGQIENDDAKGAWSPSVDILDTGEEIYICSELPGLVIEDISLEINDRILVLSGERRRRRDVKKGMYHRLERSYGKFYRAFRLSDDIDQDGVQAKLNNGVLEIHLPKKSDSHSKHVKVKVVAEDADD